LLGDASAAAIDKIDIAAAVTLPIVIPLGIMAFAVRSRLLTRSISTPCWPPSTT
jgi:hypothetical protein